MSWLAERTTLCIYKHPETGDEVYWEGIWEERPDHLDGYLYAGFAPDQVNLTVRSQFERNGRIGYNYNLGNGRKFIRSATREKYEHNLGNLSAAERKKQGNSIADSVYSSSFKRAIKDEKAKRGIK